jgi:hypothetical protein
MEFHGHDLFKKIQQPKDPMCLIYYKIIKYYLIFLKNK